MSWLTSYEDLGLDDILQITGEDNRRAPEMDEQAAAVGELTTKVKNSLGGVFAAHHRITQQDLVHVTYALIGAGAKTSRESAGLGGLLAGMGMVFEGLSARATIDRTAQMRDKTENATDKVDKHAATFTEVAELARRTHAKMTLLRDKRDEQLQRLHDNPADPDLQAEYGSWAANDPDSLKREIVKRFDEDSRGLMQSSADGYLSHAESLEPVEPYDGPRSPKPASSSIPGKDTADGSGSVPNSPGPALAPRHHPDPPSTAPASDGPALQSAPPLAPSLSTPVAPAPPPGGFLAPPSGYFAPPVAVTPPVIGARTAVGAPRTPALRPNPSGLSRPLIGERPGKAFNAFGQRQTRAVVRPESTMRPAAPPNRTAGRVNTPTGRPAAVPGRTPPRNAEALNESRTLGGRPPAAEPTETAPNAPGVRSAPPAHHPPEGRVITSRSDGQVVDRAEFSRQPRITHGGTDELNRAVVRNSRAMSTPPPPTEAPGQHQTTKHAASNVELWPEGLTKVVAPVITSRVAPDDSRGYNPGYVITPYNLGVARLRPGDRGSRREPLARWTRRTLAFP